MARRVRPCAAPSHDSPMIARFTQKLPLLLALVASVAVGSSTVHGQARPAACTQLEAQLASIDRGGGNPAQAEQVRRYEDVARRQQAELDRAMAQSRKIGCEGRGFFLFSGRQPEQCGPLTRHIQEQRANLDRVRNDLDRLRAQSGGSERDAQRRAIIGELARNDCGAQYRQDAQPSGLFEALFGSRSSVLRSTGPDMAPSGTFRTVCVRTCDGFYFPISFSTTPDRFQQDQAACQNQCPAAQAALFSYPANGDINSATSINGQPYTSLPNAFRYRDKLDPSCSCRQPGQSWADALQNGDGTTQQGDIIVTEPMGRRLSQPRFDADGKPIPEPEEHKSEQKTPPNTIEGSAEPDPNRQVRSVGPAFYPER